jgi:hypothetical protein
MVHWADKYEANKVVGRKISLRNATIPKVVKWFNEVWYFEKKIKPAQIKEDGISKTVQIPSFEVTFTNDLARTCFTELPYSMDWTDKDFYKLVGPMLKLPEEKAS